MLCTRSTGSRTSRCHRCNSGHTLGPGRTAVGLGGWLVSLWSSRAGTLLDVLDFLIQELLREANTLASKAASIELTNISVEMKVAIEQLREQVQNIE